MDAYIVYIDVLFLLNFCLDFTLFAAAGRFLRRRTPLWRLLLASLLGGAYGAAIVFSKLAIFYLPASAILVSLLLNLVAYAFESSARFLKLLAVFYGVAFAMAGAVMAVSSLLGSNALRLGGMNTMQAGTLLAAIPVALIIGRRGYAAMKRGWSKEDFSVRVEINASGQSCTIPALIDTGNDLREPLTGKPVVVVGYLNIRQVMPPRVREAYERNPELPDGAMRALAGAQDVDGWSKRLRLIPFASIGRQHGMMLGFKPDSVTLFYEGKRILTSAIVAISPRQLGDGKAYQAVVNPEMLNSAVIEEASA